MVVPKLRFKEFGGDWEQTSLGKLSEKIGDGIHATPKYDVNGIIPFINGNNLINGNIFIGKNTKQISSEEFNKYKQTFSNQTLFLSINGTIGNLAFYQGEKFLLGKSVCFINLKNEVNKKFIYFLLQSPNLIRTFDSQLTGSTIKNLSLATIRNSNFSCPIEIEQTKIANFLTQVDQKIEQLTQKHKLLTQYKKGMMQKLFSQQIRFKADDGNEFEKLIKTSINKVCYKVSSKIAAKNIIENSGKYPIFGASGFIKNINFFIEENPYIAIVKDGAGVGKLFLMPSYSSVLGTLDIIKNLDTSCNIIFLYYLLLQVDYSKYVKGSTIPHIYFKDYSEKKILLPTLPEQTKIANFLSSIDQKIDLTHQQLQQAKQWKKGLLQQMFV